MHSRCLCAQTISLVLDIKNYFTFQTLSVPVVSVLSALYDFCAFQHNMLDTVVLCPSLNPPFLPKFSLCPPVLLYSSLLWHDYVLSKESVKTLTNILWNCRG